MILLYSVSLGSADNYLQDQPVFYVFLSSITHVLYACAGQQNVNLLHQGTITSSEMITAAAQAPPRAGAGCIHITTIPVLFCNVLVIAPEDA